MKIMVCYTATSTSRDAVREAQKHARVWNAKIEVVKAVKRDNPIKRSRLEEMEEEFENEINVLFEDEDLPYDAQLQIDDIEVGEKLVRLAIRKNMDLLFIGVKKRSKVGRLLFGSTAQHVILNSPCPVVTVNPL